MSNPPQESPCRCGFSRQVRANARSARRVASSIDASNDNASGRDSRSSCMIWYESGGEGSRTILLLHGLGATAAVWKSVERAFEERGTVRWLAADLGGHGGSDWQSFYSVGQLAEQLAELVQQQQMRDPVIIGHSLGAYVALALASGWFGGSVRGVLRLGPKISWPAADVEAARELAARPVRCYPTAEEAWARYRRVSGVAADIAPGGDWLRPGGGGARKGQGPPPIWRTP